MAKKKTLKPKSNKRKRVKKHRSLPQQIRHYIITTILGGLVVVLPITLLIAALRFLWQQIQRITAPIKSLVELSDDIAAWVVDITAFGAMLFAFFLLGLFVQTNFGKQLLSFIENQLFSKVPLYTLLRDTVRQFLGNNEKMPFSEVVEVDVFNNGTRMIGFVSDEMSDGRYSVFVPTGPNPTNGFIFLVDKAQLNFVDVGPEEAMRTVVGVGTGAKEHFSHGK